MVQRVRKDRVPGFEQRGQDRGVGLEAGVEEQGRFSSFPGGQFEFQTVMERRRAPQQPGRAGACAVFPGRLGRGLRQPRIAPEAEVVVGAKIQASRFRDGPVPAQGAPFFIKGP